MLRYNWHHAGEPHTGRCAVGVFFNTENANLYKGLFCVLAALAGAEAGAVVAGAASDPASDSTASSAAVADAIGSI